MPNAKSVAARGQRARGGFPAPNGRGVSNIPPDKRAYAEQMRARQDARRSGSRPAPVVGNTPTGAQNAPGSTPPVGQMAVLNGQPVMWKGDRWGTPPSEAMGVPEAVTAPRSRSGASGPPPRAPGGQAPVPEVRSGNSQQRVSPVTGQPLGSTTGFGTTTPASPFGAGFNPLAATPFDRAALEASIKGEGWTNAGVVAGTQTDMNGAVKNPFVESQLTMASFGGQQAPTIPAQLSTPFGAAAGMAPLAGEVMTNSQVQMPIDLALSGLGATSQEVAAQDFANDAVGEVMSLQNQIRERRGMPLIVE
jgi:hypothetical protein